MQRATLHRRLLAGLFVFLSAAALQAGASSDLPGVPNFHRVNEHVYRGAQPSEKGFAILARMGVKTVIDLRGEGFEAAAAGRAGLHYVRMAWSGFKAPSDAQMAAVLALLNDSSEWPVFVHCWRGSDRTGAAIACYRISHDHWSHAQALAEAKKFGLSSMQITMRRYILSFSAPRLAKAAPTIPATILTPTAAPAQP